MTEPDSLRDDESRQAEGELDTSSSVNISEDGQVSSQPKVSTLADTIESLPGDETTASKVLSERISTSAETVPTPSKLSLIYPENTLPKLTDHFPKGTVAKKSCEKATIGRSDSADIFLNHETMARQYATLIVNTNNPHQFLIENLSPRKCIEIKNGRHSKILKAGNVEILKNNVQIILDMLQFTVLIIPGDLTAPYYEIDVKSASNIVTDKKLPVQNGFNSSSVSFQKDQYINALASGLTTSTMPALHANVSAPVHDPMAVVSPYSYINSPPTTSMPFRIPLAPPTYYPPGPTRPPVDTTLYQFSLPPIYTETSRTPFPVQVFSPTGGPSNTLPYYYPNITSVSPHPAANQPQQSPLFLGVHSPVQDTQPHTNQNFS